MLLELTNPSKSQGTQRNRKYGLVEGKTQRVFPESKPDSKGCETAVLEMVTELRNDVGKVKKIICEQNGNIDKEIET